MGTSKNVQTEILITKRPEENPESGLCVFVSTHVYIHEHECVYTCLVCMCTCTDMLMGVQAHFRHVLRCSWVPTQVLGHRRTYLYSRRLWTNVLQNGNVFEVPYKPYVLSPPNHLVRLSYWSKFPAPYLCSHFMNLCKQSPNFLTQSVTTLAIQSRKGLKKSKSKPWFKEESQREEENFPGNEDILYNNFLLKYNFP